MKTRRAYKHALSYRRVSTESQGASGVGLEGQMAAIQTYAQLERFEITEHFHDVGTGLGDKNLINRPGLQRAIEIAKATGRPIIASSVDRVSRDAQTLVEICSEHGIKIIVATGNDLRNPVVIASEAARVQREGELISKRTKDALARKKAEGVKLGNRTNLPEARQIALKRKQEIADATVEKVVSVLQELDREPNAPELVNILNERGIRTSRGGLWTLPAVRLPLKKAKARIEERKSSDAAVQYKDHPLYGRF